jgi:putative phage-type endonuclease
MLVSKIMDTVYKRIALMGIGHLFGTYPSGSPEWLADRKGAIGGSDIGAICGKSPYKSAVTLWAQRLQLIDEDQTNAAMMIGTIIEPSIVALYKFYNPELKVHTPAYTWAMNSDNRLRANPDGFIENEFGDTSILEIKYSRQHWKELPEHYRYQVIWYQTVTGLHNPATVAAITADGYVEFQVEFDADLSQQMKLHAVTFLESVQNEEMPAWDGSANTLETIRQLHPDIKDEEVSVDPDTYNQLTNALDMQELWTQQVNLRKIELMKQLNGAKWGYVEGEQVISLRARGEGKPYLHINGR